MLLQKRPQRFEKPGDILRPRGVAHQADPPDLAGQRPQACRDQQQRGPDQLRHAAQTVEQQARRNAPAPARAQVAAAGGERQHQASGGGQQRAHRRHRQRLPRRGRHPGQGAAQRLVDIDGKQIGQLGSKLDLANVFGLGLSDEWLKLDVGLKMSRPTSFWTFPIETVSQSEGGFELIHQSVVVMPHGVIAAVWLHEYAGRNLLTRLDTLFTSH